MAGYWKNPKATADTVIDGWLHTGDMGYICPEDPDFLYVVGRFKSLLISSDGEKYSPEGFEDNLTETSKFVNACVLHNNQNPYCVALIVPDKAALKEAVEAKGLDAASVEGRKAMLDILQAEVDTYKAEVKAAQARQKAAQRSVDYYKYLVREVLRRTGKEAVKGTFYGFKQSTSTTNAVNLEALKEKFLDAVNEVAHNEGLPSWADVDITAGVKNLQAYIQANDGEDADYLLTNTADTVTFSKPRKAKED
jgi:long-subunit acyl-CoA synthetase (AMP-forming)